MPITRLGGMAGRYTGRVANPDRPEYKVYRSRRRPLGDLLRPSGDLEGLRERRRRRREREPREPGAPGRITARRVLKWLALAALGWIGLSLILFVLSAQIETGVSDDTERALKGGGSLLTGSTILVVGSDVRSEETDEPGSGGPGRADTIQLWHASFGRLRKLSVPRDSLAQIPGHGSQKINAAYALGGPSLTIETIEAFLGNGLEINHYVEVSFENLPKLVDTLGGITVTAQNEVCAPPFGNFPNGLRFEKGENEVNGDRALGFARVRKNPCAPQENDLDRAQRGQELVSGIIGKAFSPSSFPRLPWVAWRAPKTIRTDLAGPGLMALGADMVTGSSDETPVLRPSCLSCGPGNSLVVSDGEKQAAVRELLGT
jgi:LCP family protein required for cell wall assembly